VIIKFLIYPIAVKI